jgi:archaellum biogenesis ATPase FlaH
MKKPPAPSMLIEAHPDACHDLADLHDVIPQREQSAQRAEPTTQPDKRGDRTLDVLARAAAYLSKVPRAVEGNGGDTATYTACANLVRDFGLSEDQAWPLLCEWNCTCRPPWDEGELREKLRNAVNYGDHPIGQKANQPSPWRGGGSATDTSPEEGGPPWYTIKEVHDRPSYRAGLRPIETGFPSIDQALAGGLRPQCVYVLAGRTGSAKSTLALNIARYLALADQPVLIFKLEEPLEEAAWRIHAATAQVDLRAFLNAEQQVVGADIAEAWDLLADLPIRLSDQRRIHQIERIAREHADAGGKVVILDQISMVDVPDVRSIYEQITTASNRLRIAARDSALAVVVVAQINRAASKDKGDLSIHDLRDSGYLENDAAGVILINRIVRPDAPRWYTDPLTLEVLIGKNRYGRMTNPEEPILLNWWPAMCRIEDARHIPSTRQESVT